MREESGWKQRAYLRLFLSFVGVVSREWGVLIDLITAVGFVEARCRWASDARDAAIVHTLGRRLLREIVIGEYKSNRALPVTKRRLGYFEGVLAMQARGMRASNVWFV